MKLILDLTRPGSVLHSPWTYTWSQVAAYTRDVWMIFSGNMSYKHHHRPWLVHGPKPKYNPQQERHHGHSSPPFSLQFCPSSLHNAQTALLLFLSYLSTAYMHIAVTPGVGWPLGWWVSGCTLPPALLKLGDMNAAGLWVSFPDLVVWYGGWPVFGCCPLQKVIFLQTDLMKAFSHLRFLPCW